MKSNFEFLDRYWPALAQIGAAAESYVYSDANACLYKLGMVPNEIFSIGLDYREISLYAYLLRCENRETYQC